MAITQVTGTGFDTNVEVLIPDLDGTTCWAFQGNFGNGYARFNLSSGAIVQAGQMFNGAGGFFDTTREGADLPYAWAQGDNGEYYVEANSQTIYQFHIGGGGTPNAEPLGSYSKTDNSVAVTISGGVSEMVAWTNGGTHYLAWCGPVFSGGNTFKLFVYDADTWTQVGVYQTSVTGSEGNRCTVFADKYNRLWMIGYAGEPVHFVLWDPANGATLGNLNVTDSTVTNDSMGFPYSTSGGAIWTRFAAYIPSNHSVLLQDSGYPSGSSWCCDLANLDLASLTPNHYRVDDGSFCFNPFKFWGDFYDNNLIENRVGQQPSGNMMIQSDTIGSGFNTQVGGIFRIIDPINLTASQVYDITQAIVAQGGGLPTPPQNASYGSFHGTSGAHYDSITAMVYNETLGVVAVTYLDSNTYNGSALYLVPVSAGPPPAPEQPVVVVCVS